MWLQICICLFAIANFVYGIYFEMNLTVPVEVSPHRHMFGGNWKFLTYINLWIQVLYFSIALLNIIFGSNSVTSAGSSRLQRARDYLFATLAFPIGIFVGLMFWGLYFYNRNTIFSEAMDKYIPPLENHVLHTAVLIFPTLQISSIYHIYPKSKSGIFVTLLFSLSYLIWVCIIAYFGGFWVYPIFRILGPISRMIFILTSCIVIGSMYYLGVALNGLIWKRHVDKIRSKRFD